MQPAPLTRFDARGTASQAVTRHCQSSALRKATTTGKMDQRLILQNSVCQERACLGGGGGYSHCHFLETSSKPDGFLSCQIPRLDLGEPRFVGRVFLYMFLLSTLSSESSRYLEVRSRVIDSILSLLGSSSLGHSPTPVSEILSYLLKISALPLRLSSFHCSLLSRHSILK